MTVCIGDIGEFPSPPIQEDKESDPYYIDKVSVPWCCLKAHVVGTYKVASDLPKKTHGNK